MKQKAFIYNPCRSHMGKVTRLTESIYQEVVEKGKKSTRLIESMRPRVDLSKLTRLQRERLEM